MKVLITGDRDWTDDFFLDVVINGLLTLGRRTGQTLELIHGGARGADSMADVWRIIDDVDVRKFPADWTTHGRSAGPIRNRVMLDENPDLVIAFHDDLEQSKGTRDCVKEARRRKIPVWLLAHAA